MSIGLRSLGEGGAAGELTYEVSIIIEYCLTSGVSTLYKIKIIDVSKVTKIDEIDNHYIVVRLCVRLLQKVSGNDLTPRNRRLYLWPLSDRS